MDELFNMANFFTLLVATKRFLFGRGEGTFVVTSKRGGEGRDERVVLPQYVLAAFTLMALLWSWLGLGFGVTDDLVGAGVATFWALYNLTLTVTVLGFTLRPVQKRQAVRFRTPVPVDVVGDRTDGRVGVTLELAEGGCTLLWPAAMPVGTRRALRLHLGPRVIECDGEVRSVHARRRSGWVVHGVHFLHADNRTVDQLADAIYNMSVPEIFSRLSQLSWISRQWRALTLRLSRGVHRAARHEACLPVRVTAAGGEFLATTRDMSRSGVSLVSPRAFCVGAHVRIRLTAAGETWTSMATVARVTPIPASRPEYVTWNVGLHVDASNVSGLAGVPVGKTA
jgi:hypothetical protein